ncbi:hypothetical protein E5K90_05545 [Helicobacter pylori]|nr:hypothetical protein E5K90_05545 [Helicobacter pylori]
MVENLALLLLSVGYQIQTILHFLRLDSKEIDFIKRYFYLSSGIFKSDL